MGSHITEEQTLYATLCEIERGLFHVTYRMDGKGLGQHQLPRFEVGVSAPDARLRVEQRARECGYASVVWDSASAEPPIGLPGTNLDVQLSH